MTTTQTIIGAIVIFIIIIVFGLGIGWFFAKYKEKRFLKKLDKKIHEPEQVNKIIETMKEQAKSENEREVIQDGRRRKLLGGNGNRGYGSRKFTEAQQLGDIKELVRREPEVKRTTEQSSNNERDGKREQLSDTKSNENREIKSHIGENEQEPDWNW